MSSRRNFLASLTSAAALWPFKRLLDAAMAEIKDILASALLHLRKAKRITGTYSSYAYDNPSEYALVKAYLDGGERPTVSTEMGQGLVEIEDARRQAAGTEPPPPPPPPPTPPPPPPGIYPNGSPYPVGSFWNPGMDARSAPLDPNSASKISYFVQNMGPALFNVVRWTVATQTLKGVEKKYDVSITKYPAGTILPAVPIPAGTKPDPAGDGHLVILDFAGGFEYQMWQAKYDSTADKWSCGSGYKLALDARAVPAGKVGAYDANFPLMAGVVTPEELKAAVTHGTDVGHPLIYAPNAVTRSGGSPRCPATANAGSGSSSGLPNGAWIALDPTLDVGALSIPDWQKAIARTLQHYGAFIRDGSSTSTDWSGENPINRDPTLWNTLFGWTSAQTFSSSFPWSRLRVLQPPC